MKSLFSQSKLFESINKFVRRFQFLNNFIIKIKSFVRKLTGIFNKSNDKNVPVFQKLTPVNNVDLTIYKNALDFVFKNKDIRNIAISGPYSSGKSSIIETYKKYCKNKRFLHISLAHFTEMEINKGSKGSDVNETILEGKILNQLLHQIDASKIPQTDFKIKRTIQRRKIIFFTLLFVFSILFFQYILNFEKWNTFIDSIYIEWLKNILIKTTTSQLLIIAGIFMRLLEKTKKKYIINRGL